jgi:hypothetical protein
MLGRAQSAVEFLATYGFIFLIISFVIVILYVYVGTPASLLPFECSPYNTFSCSDALISPANAPGTSELVVVLSYGQPGILNLSSFNATIDNIRSVNGSCVPDVVISGEQSYCVAAFNSPVVIGNIYTGTFLVKGNYCQTPSSIISSTQSCPSGSNYSWGGFLRLSGSATPLSLVSVTEGLVPITITNTQNSITPVGFQQLISFSPATYSAHERSDLGNIRFYYDNVEMYSWCEKNCNSSATSNALFWVNLPFSIPPGKNRTIYMYFLPGTTQYDGANAGAAPNLTSTYAQYDNGRNVFLFYDNFNSTKLNTQAWTPYNIPGEGSLAVSYGVTFYELACPCGTLMIRSTQSFSSPIVVSSYVTSVVGAYQSMAALDQGTWNGYSQWVNSGSSMVISQTTANPPTYKMVSSKSASLNGNGQGVWMLNWSQQGNESVAWPGGEISFNNNAYRPGSVNIVLGQIGGTAGSMVVSWVLARYYPPNGVMPSVSFGPFS